MLYVNASKPKLKVGDRVEVVRGAPNVFPFHLVTGTFGRVTRVLQGGLFVDVRMDGEYRDQEGWDSSRFKLVEESKREYIVVVKQHGRFAPSAEPRVFKSERQAVAVAKSMAEKHGGEFFVFASVANAVKPKPEIITVEKAVVTNTIS